MKVPLPVRALATGAVALSLIAASAASAVAAEPAQALVEVIDFDPNAGATPPDYRLAYALQQAEERAFAKPDVYGKPYVKWNTLYVPVIRTDAQAEASAPVALPPDLSPADDGTDDTSVTPPPDSKDADGTALSPAATAAAKQAAPQQATAVENPYIITPKAPLVKYSLTRLAAIQDEVLGLTATELPDTNRLFTAQIIADRDQVLLESNAPTEPMRAALAARYGADAVVIRTVTDAAPAEPKSRDRDSPNGGFWAGAWIRTNVKGKCTDAFSWRSNGAAYMLTAGHCTSLGGWAGTQVTGMGNVVNDTWANGVGSVRVNGVYRGDLSLIKLDAGLTSAATMYVGGVTSTSARPVGAMWSRRSAVGDKYCTGGASTGEHCGWTVTAVGITVKYDSGTIVRNTVKGMKLGQCLIGGDSGGPVYTVNSVGKVVAKGVTSGGGGGGSDDWGGAWDRCEGYFTDIWDAYYGLPGYLATR
ncbi:S1 family peptidase [Yinghuangia soli]|uniref:S1 family peptidase n=1 Tax=Yinghuangia soli TaxID=2908204 RepID=A0AA41TWI8_9ACTN|nr:S1 family peptidase [Yinghuangia soli]MCF2525898.1 S1 family peptidase [Yinghuangia soli]